MMVTSGLAKYEYTNTNKRIVNSVLNKQKIHWYITAKMYMHSFSHFSCDKFLISLLGGRKVEIIETIN